jgi:hypothetical protein
MKGFRGGFGTKIAARPVRPKPLPDKDLRQLFTIQAAIHPITKESESTMASHVRIFSPFLLEKPDQKQANNQ